MHPTIRQRVEATPLRVLQLQLVPSLPQVKCRTLCLTYVPFPVLVVSHLDLIASCEIRLSL